MVICDLVFQAIIIVSGNLSFLNWLTMLPCIFFFDDCHFSFLFSKKTLNKVKQLQLQPRHRLSISKVAPVEIGILTVVPCISRPVQIV